MRHLRRRQNLKSTRLVRLRVSDGKPLVAAGSIPNEEGRQAAHSAGLKVLPNWHFTQSEVCDVPSDVSIGKVHRRRAGKGNAGSEIVEIARLGPRKQAIQLL